MKRIVHENSPVADLPEDLREGFAAAEMVRVTIEFDDPMPEKAPTLGELLAVSRPPYRSTEELVEELRRERDAWDE